MDTRERRTRERLYEQEQVSVRYRLDSIWTSRTFR